jgi:hypothetical protein
MMSRAILDHVVTDGDLSIQVLDEPGPGGACHKYEISGYEPNVTPFGSAVHYVIGFQKGPVFEAGLNGLTQEALLAIVIDRLRGFQSGQFSCRENAIALTHCEDALMWLQKRTRNRLARGVEGTSEK